MCMITQVPGGVETPLKGIRNGAAANDDGHGVAIFTNSGIEMMKSMQYEEVEDFLLSTRRNKEPFLLHSRWATHGPKDTTNVHPFYVGDSGNVVMAHNGILPYEYYPTAKGDTRSDTRVFVDRLDELMRSLNRVPSRREARVIGNIIGAGNKLTFMAMTENGPRTRIVNAYAGVQAQGVWYSNSGFLHTPFWQSYSRRSNHVEVRPERGNQVQAYLARVAERNHNDGPNYMVGVACFYCGMEEVTSVMHYCDNCGSCNDCFQADWHCVCGTGRKGDPFWNDAYAGEYDDSARVGDKKTEDFAEAIVDAVLNNKKDDKYGQDIEVETSAGKELIAYDGYSPTNIAVSDGRAGWGE